MNDSKVQLLPEGGAFIIHTEKDGLIKGRFSMYALDLFCENKKVENYLDLLTKLALGMKLGDYADLIVVAIQDYHRKNPSGANIDREMVMDMIDKWGGVNSDQWRSLIKHALGRVMDAAPQAAPGEETEEQKKSELNNISESRKSSTESSSSVTPSKPDSSQANIGTAV